MMGVTEILIYQNQEGNIKIDVSLEEDTVWLRQMQIAELFRKGRSTIAEHIQNVFKEGELEENSVCRNFRHTEKQLFGNPEQLEATDRKFRTVEI